LAGAESWSCDSWFIGEAFVCRPFVIFPVSYLSCQFEAVAGETTDGEWSRLRETESVRSRIPHDQQARRGALSQKWRDLEISRARGNGEDARYNLGLGSL